MKKTDLVNIHLGLTEKFAPRLFQLLTMGFRISIHEDMGIKDLLCDRLGVAPEYLEERIQTIFLNGKAVDDESDVKVRPGATLALSAAMPGIAGALMRKQGRYAPMREEISHRVDEASDRVEPAGEVVVKLFNIIARELGPGLFARGVMVGGEAFQRVIRREPEAFGEGCLWVKLDGDAVSAETLLARNFGGEVVRVWVEGPVKDR